MTENRDILLPREGHLPEGRPVNPVEPQKSLGIGGDKYFRTYRRHPELKSRKLADIQRRSNQTLNSLYSLPMTAHPHPHPRPEAPGAMEHRKEGFNTPTPNSLSTPAPHPWPSTAGGKRKG